MGSNYSIKNIFENADKKRVVGFLLAGVVIVILLVVLILMLASGNETDSGDEQSVEEMQQETLVSTEYNENHEYTLDEYLPWTYYEYLEDGSGVDVKYDITENTAIPKGIVVTLGGCEEEANRASADAYLNSLPIELDEYEITYLVKGCGE